MSMYRRWFPALLTALMLALLAGVWLVFAPVQLGGQAAYIIITGNSMEPRFHTGDLVVVHVAPVYAVGDVVAYHNAELRNIVFHRIVGTRLDHFIFKGDHNSWTDSYQPAPAELIGTLWIHLPSVGKAVTWARQPLNFTIIAAVLGGIFMGTLLLDDSKNKARRPGRMRDWLGARKQWLLERVTVTKAPADSPALGARPEAQRLVLSSGEYASVPPSQAQKPGGKFADGVVEASYFVLGLLGFGSLVLGIFALARPAMRTVQDNIAYQHLGIFSYSAAASPDVYDAGTINPVQPIFPNLTCNLNVTFSYVLVGDAAEGLTGTQEIEAQVLDPASGWQRTTTLVPSTAFAGKASNAKTSVNLCEMEALTQRMEQATNYAAPSYTLRIVPKIDIRGTLHGRQLQDTFQPALTFQFDRLHVFLARPDPKADPLSPTADGLLPGTRIEANTLPLLGMQPEVGKLRLIALLGLILAACGLFVLSRMLGRMAQDKQAYIRMKYGALLVDIANQNGGLARSPDTIEFASIDDLARLADRRNSMILHESSGNTHYYFVQGDGITYRYALDQDDTGLVEVAPTRAADELRRAFERGEFQVYYQPIVSLADGKITSVEALLRWQHPQRGLISAREFIPLAESSGLIEPLGEWMLQVACSQLKDWQLQGLPLVLSVNFAEKQMERDPARTVARALKKCGLDPRDLEIEIPENGILMNASKLIPRMQELKDLGIQVSIDNFDGRLPASTVSQYPISSIKLDRMLVQGMSLAENATAMNEMSASAKSAGLTLIAVGVETEAQLEQMRAQACAQVQGLYVGDPAPAGEITHMLLKGDRLIKPASPKKKQPAV